KYFEMNKERLGYKQLLHTSLQEGYDFHSDYCTRLLNEADIVVTNPPFSLFRDFFKWLMQCPDKRFIVLSSQNAVTYKEVFPYIRDNKVWLGNVNMGCPLLFNVSEEAQKELRDTKQEGKGYKIKDGEIKARVPAIWFTNCDYNARYEDNILVEKYSPDKYPKYDNYDVIEVSKINKIPLDYDGVMGVPISFLSHHNPKQFDIVALRRNPDGTVEPWTVEREREFNDTILSNDDRWVDEQSKGYYDKWQEHLCSSPDTKEMPVDICYPNAANLTFGLVNDYTVNGKKGYVRILIRRRTNS
ncbi:MAG: adenine-specific methyltransferase EcoRI family protein, partial [Prevotella sp.]|nr:adenine-specific methyltransferase EcoRI family protein [Prevotella sp.]